MLFILVTLWGVSATGFIAAICGAALQEKKTATLFQATLKSVRRFNLKGGNLMRFSFHKSAGY